MAFFRASTLTHLKYLINSFLSNIPVITPQNTKKNWFAGVFRGYKIGKVAR